MPKFDKTKVAVGLNSHSHLDLSHDHITSSNFMDLQPVCYRHMIPNEKLSVQANAFARLAPLAVPTYGRARLNMRAFFVPFRTVMPRFTEFITDTVASKFVSNTSPSVGIVASTPIIQASTIVSAFNNGVIVYENGTYPLTEAGTSSTYDYVSGGNYYRFTVMGRRLYKVLLSLGYEIIPAKKSDIIFSALGLLCYLRIFFDWYSVSQYMDTSTYQRFASWFTYDDPNSRFEMSSSDLIALASYVLRVAYDGDYFTSAWDNPVAPNSGLYSSFLLPDISVGAGVVTQSPNGTPVVQGSSSVTDVSQLSQYSIDALKALTDYMKRHQLAGARQIDRYLADFGINLDADKLDRSTYLGLSSMDIKIGDVMSHANTSTDPNESNLGDYAGQGIINGGKRFDFTTSEFGMFIIVSSILPSGGYYQGFDRNNLHTTKDQFFLPDFDALGVQSIAKGELYVSPNEVFVGDGSYSETFGYISRYAEYKAPRNFVTGDIRVKSALVGGDSWHMMREFDDLSFDESLANVVHSLPFCLGRDASQYNRIFNYKSDDKDKFYIVYHFDIGAYSPCKSLFDTYEFENQNKEITMDANGVKMN